LLDFG